MRLFEYEKTSRPLAHSNLAQVQSGRVAGAPGSLEVVASDGTIQIKDLPCQKQPRLQSALHVLKIHFT